MKYNLGRVTPIYRGNYNPQQDYTELDIVLYGGSSFICLTDCKGQTPSEGENSYWGLLAKHGERDEMTQAEIDALIAAVYNAMVDHGAVFDGDYTHTDNNFTDQLKAVITDIQTNSGKYINVQANWDETNTQSPAYIANKPDFIIDGDYVHTDNNFTDELLTKLQTVDVHAEENVQADWNVTNSQSDAFIKNKPTIPTHTSQLTNNSNFIVDANYRHIDNNFTNSLKAKLESTNVLTDAMVTRINSTIPAPTEYNVSATSYTIGNLVGNVVYNFTTPITSLQISATNVDYVPTLLYFTTGNTFRWQFPNNMRTTQYVDFDPNQSYVMAVMNNIMTYIEVED